MDEIEKIVDAVLYEGYILWPYRRSAGKNQQRWTFGCLFPRAYSEATGGSDGWFNRTECLVVGDDPVIDVRARWLQVVERQVEQRQENGHFTPVDALGTGDEMMLTWEEARECEAIAPGIRLSRLPSPVTTPIDVPAGDQIVQLADGSGNIVGRVVRRWQRLRGEVAVSAHRLRPGLFRLTVQVVNALDIDGIPDTRDAAARQALVSAHVIFRAHGGEFVSLTDPPVELVGPAVECRNIGTWPVLAGQEGDRHLLLSSPIILPDYPQVAPESSGDLFDAAEIDQLMLLSVLSLTDDEKAEMRATDPQSREILRRAEAMTNGDFMQLHGAIRDFRLLRDQPIHDNPIADPFSILDRPAPESIVWENIRLRAGDRVRLNPSPGGDIFDLALAGRTATIQRIDQDFENRLHLAVTVDDDPGRDLGNGQSLGHLFYFRPEEIEPLEKPEGAGR